jgi:hypothetical protein
MKGSSGTPSSAELVQQISAKRRLDLVTAAHTALATNLRKDKKFAKRYPILSLEPYRFGNEVGLSVGTRRSTCCLLVVCLDPWSSDPQVGLTMRCGLSAALL